MFLCACIWLYMFEVMVFCVIYAHFIFVYSLLVSTYHLMSYCKIFKSIAVADNEKFCQYFGEKNRNTV